MIIRKNNPTTIISLMAFLVGLFQLLSLGGDAIAWGPERQTYTNNSPASYATFNSITDNAAVGDERNFVRIRELGTEEPYKDEINIVPGKEYEVYIYYHNNAASSTNATGFGVATDTRAYSIYPSTINPGEEGTITGVISWSYVTPADPEHAIYGKVWDEAFITTNQSDVSLKYKPGTAIIHNGGGANGMVLSDNLFTNDGALIGFNNLVGVIRGCAEYSGHITYTLIAERTDALVEKKVSLDGENWSDRINVKPGDEVTYKTVFKNTGTTLLDGIILKDTNEAGILPLENSIIIYDKNNPSGSAVDESLRKNGHNAGNLDSNSEIQVIYKSKISEDEVYCGKIIKNKIVVNYNSGMEASDEASVYVVCEGTPEIPPEEPEKTCKTNPEMPECQELPNTGPLEIALAVLVILGIGGGGYYLYRTHRTLTKVENEVKGEVQPEKTELNDESIDSSQNKENMIK